MSKTHRRRRVAFTPPAVGPLEPLAAPSGYIPAGDVFTGPVWVESSPVPYVTSWPEGAGGADWSGAPTPPDVTPLDPGLVGFNPNPASDPAADVTGNPFYRPPAPPVYPPPVYVFPFGPAPDIGVPYVAPEDTPVIPWVQLIPGPPYVVIPIVPTVPTPVPVAPPAP